MSNHHPQNPYQQGYPLTPGQMGGQSPMGAQQQPVPSPMQPQYTNYGNPRTPGSVPMQNMYQMHGQNSPSPALTPGHLPPQQNMQMQQQNVNMNMGMGMGPVPSSNGNPEMHSMQQQSQPQYQQQQQQPHQQQLQQQFQNQNSQGPTPSTNANNQLQQQQQQPPQSQQQRELNAASLCRFGQENVQELVSRAQEIFNVLRSTQPPDGKPLPPGAIDRKPKIQDTLRNIKALFKRLRVIYEKIEESFPSTENMNSEVEGLIPYDDSDILDDEDAMDVDDRKQTEAYKQALEEHREVVEQVVSKNRNLKEAIDHLRNIIWDINTMLAMRKD